MPILFIGCFFISFSISNIFCWVECEKVIKAKSLRFVKWVKWGTDKGEIEWNYSLAKIKIMKSQISTESFELCNSWISKPFESRVRRAWDSTSTWLSFFGNIIKDLEWNFQVIFPRSINDCVYIRFIQFNSCKLFKCFIIPPIATMLSLHNYFDFWCHYF